MNENKKYANNIVSIIKRKINDNPIWLPSRVSLIEISILTFIIFLITQIGMENRFGLYLPEFEFLTGTIKITNQNSEITNIVTIFSGVGAITVALVFFIAQSMIDKNDLDIGRVLLYESKIYILLVFDIYTYIILLYNQFNSFIYLILIFEFLLLIYSITKTISLIIENVKLIDAKTNMYISVLKKYQREFFDKELIYRKYRDEYFSLLDRIEDKGNHIRLDNFRVSNTENYINIYSNLEGVFIGYDEPKILHLIELIRRFDSKLSVINFDNSMISENENNSFKPSVVFIPKIFDNIKRDTLIARVDRNILKDNTLQREIREIIRRGFLIDKDKTFSSAEYELRNLRHRCLLLLKDDKTTDYIRTLNIYIDLIKEIYEQFRKNNLRFDNKKAEEYRSSFPFSKLKSIDWIIEDIYSILKASFETNDEDIFYESTYFPIKLLKLSIENNDHIIFQNFNEYSRLIYIKGFELKDSNSSKSEFLIDRSWRYIKELADIYLINNYEKNNLPKDDFMGYAKYIVKMFQDLIKQSYDFKDFQNYRVFIEKLQKIANTNYYLDDSFNTSVENREKKFNSIVQEALFGVTSWISYDALKSENPENGIYFNFVFNKLPNKLKSITMNYINASINCDDWKWYLWEREKNKEDFEIKINYKLSYFYLIKFLSIIHISEIEIQEFVNDLDETSLYFVKSNLHHLKSARDNIAKTHETVFKGIIIFENIKLIDEFLNKIENRINLIENEKVRLSDLDNKRVESFKENFLNNYKSAFGIRDIISNSIKIKRSTKMFTDLDSRGLRINRIYDKQIFINPEILPDNVYLDFDESFNIGEGFKNGENKVIINDLISKSVSFNLHDLNSHIRDIKRENEPVVLNINGYFNILHDNEDIDYIPSWSNEISKDLIAKYPKCDGELILKENLSLPIFDIHDDSFGSLVIIFETNNLCSITQVLPAINNKKITMYENFEIKLLEYKSNSSEFHKIINEKPNWLSEKGNINDQIDYLKLKVIIQIIEIFNIEINKKAKIFMINKSDVSDE